MEGVNSLNLQDFRNLPPVFLLVFFLIVSLSLVSLSPIGQGYFLGSLRVWYWTGLFSWISPGLLLDEFIFLPVTRPAIGRIHFPCLSPGLLLDGVIALVPTIDTPCYQVLWIRCSPIICFFYKHCKNSLFRLDRVWNLVTCWFCSKSQFFMQY